VTVATHRSSERHPADRGLQFGRAQSRAVANTVAVYERMLREDRGLESSDVGKRGREAAARIRAFRPALAEEIEGIASGVGQAPDVLFAINARTELLAGGLVAGTGECSTVAVLDRERASGVLVQNWDFHPDLAASRVLWTVDDGDQRRFTTFTEAGILAKIGSNAHGVALAINFLATDRDGGLDGVPVHVLCRAVLEEARTVQEGRELIARTPVSASVCMTVAGPGGLDGAAGVEACALERWPGGTEEQATGPDRTWVAHTNHFLDPIAARDTLAEGPSGPSTHGRMDRLVATLEDAPALDGTQIAALLGSRGGPGVAPIFQTDDPTLPWLERCATLATIGLEVPSGRLWIV
jgi:isopenicillin-N N-acyltransferase-like protein